MTAYEFYTDTYRGTAIPADEWPAACRNATAQVAKYERTYTVTYPEEESRDLAVCAIADAMFAFDRLTNGSGPVVSASVGSVSESVQQQSSNVDTSPAAQAAELYRCLCLYAEVYRGCSPCR